MIGQFASLKLYVTAVSVGIITVFLPCVRLVAAVNGEKQTFYSSVMKSNWGVFILILYILALVLTAKNHPVPAVIAGFLGAGLETDCVFTRAAGAAGKLTARGYTVVKTGYEYGIYIMMIGLMGLIMGGLWAISEYFGDE